MVVSLLGLSVARPGPGQETEDLIPLTEELGIRLFPFPHLTRVRTRGSGTHTRVSLTQDTAASQTDKGLGFFSDNPLTSVKRSFQVSSAMWCPHLVNIKSVNETGDSLTYDVCSAN